MAYNTYRSCLIPYEKEIVALRLKKPPMPYSKIAALLYDKYQIAVCRETILRFLQVRAKGYKPCKYAKVIEPINPSDQPTTEKTPLQKTTVLQTPKPSVPNKPTTPVELKPEEVFEMPFSETYSLDLLSPEEAAVWLKQIKERNKQ